MADAKISVRLDTQMQRRLDEEVAATGTNESELVRMALAAYFAERPRPMSCLELAQRHHLIGCAEDLPPDLSSNPRHFEGFGR